MNRGADLACTGCGATRDKDVQFFLEDDAPEVGDEALLGQARAGADWLCLFCQTSNRPDRTHCRQCGGERGTAPSRPVREVPPAAPPPGPATQAPRSGLLRWVVAAVLLLVLGFCYLSLRKSEDSVRVAGFQWSRAIDVEAFRTLREEAWEGSLPAGARELSRRRDVHHTDHVQVGTKRVKVGKKDLGNGFFEDVYEDQPVYQDRPVHGTKITYDVDRWMVDRTARASGQDQSPRWPDAGLGPRERAGARHASYVVLLEGRKQYRMELPEERWAALRPGQTFHAVVQGGSKVLSLQ